MTNDVPIGRNCVVGVYGAYENHKNCRIKYFSTKDMAVGVGYGYSVLQNQIFVSHPRQQIQCGEAGKIKSGVTIIMTLDLINRRLSFQSSLQKLPSIGIGICVSDKLKYRMAVHFGKKCSKQLITIKMLDCQVNPVNYKNDIPSINIDEQKILESDYDCRKILVKYFKTSKKV
eukprot:245916_1